MLAPHTVRWSVWMDSNHRPHAYQACALATWATDRFFLRLYSVRSTVLNDGIRTFNSTKSSRKISLDRTYSAISLHDACIVDRKLVEMKGFEPLTPCLQGRCSPNWATPPLGVPQAILDWSLTIEQQNLSVLANTLCPVFCPNLTTSAQLNLVS